jgi:CheY-like chemotaxis protein
MSAKGFRVFVVEDEAMIRMMVVDMLEELGHSVSAEAGRLDQALQLAQSTDFDLAILDVNLDGKIVTPGGAVDRRPRPPNHFCDRYGAAGLPEEFKNRPALQNRSSLKPWWLL